MKEMPNYYSIIPANVRYCQNLSAQEKLLYSEITALTNYKGYCWATNGYFADLYNLSKKTISRQINNLAENKFIHVEMIYFENSNQIQERRIYLLTPDVQAAINGTQNANTPMDKNADTPMDKNADTPMDKNADTPMDKNAEDNNTRYNNKKNNTNTLNNILSYPISSNLIEEKAEKEKTDKIGFDKIPNQSVQVIETGEKKEGCSNATTPLQGQKHLEQPRTTKYNYNDVEATVKQNIDYEYLVEDKFVDNEMLDEVVFAITTTICTEFKDGYVQMGNELVPASAVKSIFFKINSEHVKYFLDCFNRQTEPVTKLLPYIRKSLYENYGTISHHYSNRVHVDMPYLAKKKIRSEEVD